VTSSRSGRSYRAARAAAGVALIATLGAVAVAMQIDRETRFAAREPAGQVLYVSSPAVLTRAVLSFDALAADLYWIRAIQYYGRNRLLRKEGVRYDLLYPLLDLTTSLDPRFSVAYRFGAFFLSERAPGGADRPDLSIRLLEKAIAVNPDRWEYPHDIGFVHYRRGNFKEAAEWFRRASRVPGATNWLEPLAAVTLATGGDLESSRLLWQNILETSEQSWLRTAAQQRLRQLDAAETKRRLEQLTAEYERRHGDPPASWEALVRDGAIPGIPLDPAGYPYVLNPWWGMVDVSDDSPMWPLPLDNPR
jgi:tetratricopeptide (TPR) repeat protein